MPQDACRALDHLLIGAPTIEGGIAWLEEKTGVRATKGGSHPGLGTWNALASLGPTQYIEIIAPDPAQADVETFYVPGLRDFVSPRVTTWAARASDIRRGFRAALPSDFSCEQPRQGSRVRLDGARLAWTLAFPKSTEHATFGGALPFFIEWESVENHPGRTTPPGLTLLNLSLGHPEPEALRMALQGLGIDCAVNFSAAPLIRAEIDTPLGRIVL